MRVLNIEKIAPFQEALVLGQSLKAIATLDEASSYEGLVSALSGIFDDDMDLDDIGCNTIDLTSRIVTFLDCIGVAETLVNDLLSDNDEISRDSLGSIAKTFNENFDEDSIFDIAMKYANEYKFDNVTLDTMPPRKQGYKRTQVIKDGKKVWVNKRVSGKKVKQSPAQKRALIKARLKAHTGAAKIKRSKSVAKRKTFKM